MHMVRNCYNSSTWPKTSKWCVSVCFWHPAPNPLHNGKTNARHTSPLVHRVLMSLKSSSRMKNVTGGCCCLRSRITVSGCLVLSSVFLLLLLLWFLCWFLPLFRIFSKRDSFCSSTFMTTAFWTYQTKTSGVSSKHRERRRISYSLSWLR